MYYIFAFIKGVMRFVVILLIGTGWSLLKPYLNDREKKIVLVVLALQVNMYVCTCVRSFSLRQAGPSSLDADQSSLPPPPSAP